LYLFHYFKRLGRNTDWPKQQKCLEPYEEKTSASESWPLKRRWNATTLFPSFGFKGICVWSAQGYRCNQWTCALQGIASIQGHLRQIKAKCVLWQEQERCLGEGKEAHGGNWRPFSCSIKAGSQMFSTREPMD
jgi:hypothetical protein